MVGGLIEGEEPQDVVEQLLPGLAERILESDQLEELMGEDIGDYALDESEITGAQYVNESNAIEFKAWVAFASDRQAPRIESDVIGTIGRHGRSWSVDTYSLRELQKK